MKIIKNIKLTDASGFEFMQKRIPALTSLESGELLAFYECRSGESDWSVPEIRMTRVGNNLELSSETVVAKADPDGMVNNPCAFAVGNRVGLLWLKNYRRLFVSISDDGGRSWRTRGPLDFIEDFRREYDFTVIAAGPGHAATLPSGRIVAPVWLASNHTDPKAHHPSRVATVYSDDRGESWHIGEFIPTDSLTDPSEIAVAATERGVLFNIRHDSPIRRRFLSESKDGTSAYTHLGYSRELLDPICQGSMCDAGGAVYYCGCHSETEREELTVYRSIDCGRSWTSPLRVAESAAYSDLAASKDGKTLYIVYECDSYGCIRLAVIDTRDDR